MKGLLVKDLCLLKNQKKLIPVVVILAVWFTAFGMNTFGFMYLGMMAVIVATGTLAYDEFDHGYPFLFTLPFGRKTYVREKFLLGGMLLAAGEVLALLCAAVAAIVKPGSVTGGEMAAAAAASVLVCAAILGVTIPLRIRYGSEKGRFVLFIVFGAGALLLLGVGKVLPRSVTGGLTDALEAHAALTAVIGVVLAVVICAAGYAVAVRQIVKKEF